MRETLASWAAQASHLIADCFDHCKPLIDPDFVGLPADVRFVSAQLFIDCHLSSESVLLLVREEKTWDADLIMRSVLEGSFKHVYMLLGTAEEMSRKVDEYWNVLPRFQAIRRSANARRTLALLPNQMANEWRPFRDLILSEDEIAQIRVRYSRTERQRLEEAWSFAGICRTLVSTVDLSQFSILAHAYAMSSHGLHKDADGVGMVWERYRRDPQHQEAVAMGHAARIVSDTCAFAKLRMIALLRACDQPLTALTGIEDRYQHLSDSLRVACDCFLRIEYGLPT